MFFFYSEVSNGREGERDRQTDRQTGTQTEKEIGSVSVVWERERERE